MCVDEGFCLDEFIDIVVGKLSVTIFFIGDVIFSELKSSGVFNRLVTVNGSSVVIISTISDVPDPSMSTGAWLLEGPSGSFPNSIVVLSRRPLSVDGNAFVSVVRGFTVVKVNSVVGSIF